MWHLVEVEVVLRLFGSTRLDIAVMTVDMSTPARAKPQIPSRWKNTIAAAYDEGFGRLSGSSAANVQWSYL